MASFILPVDDTLQSEAAIAQLIRWIGPSDRVTLVHMISDLMPMEGDETRFIYHAHSPIEREGMALLEAHRERFPLDVPVEIVLLEGLRTRGLPRFLESRDEDFIIMGSQGLGSTVRAVLLGSLATKVLICTGKPLLVITKKEKRRDQMKHILIPIDGSQTALRAVDQGRILQDQFGAKVTLFYVMPDPRKEGLSEGTESVLRQMEEGRGKAEALLRTAAERLDPDREVELLLRVGVVKREIEQYAQANEVDLIIMGTQGMGSALKRLLLGSVTKHVLEHVEVPVLVVR